jgi:hypothetical protein
MKIVEYICKGYPQDFDSKCTDLRQLQNPFRNIRGFVTFNTVEIPYQCLELI